MNARTYRPGRTLYSGWVVSLVLLAAIVVRVGQTRAAPSPAPDAPAGWAAAPAWTAPSSSLLAHAAPRPDSLDLFGHDAHDGLFPLCTGCHIGAETGDLSALYPDPESCLSCHDGTTEELVEWDGPSVLETNLVFDHGDHLRLVEAEGDTALTCAQCHGDPAPAVLADPRVVASECLSCHEDPADDTGHYVGADCSTCHVPAAASTLGTERISGLPTPPDHTVDASETFLTAVHGEGAQERVDERCSTCHVQDQCADCHVNAARVVEIRSLPPAPAGRGFASLEARYPTPADHATARFAWEHIGIAEPEGANCATCHTAETCRTCHLEPVPEPVAALAGRDTVTAPGAEVDARAPESHESHFFMERHGTVAATSEGSCATCHRAESFCASCHERQAEGGASYHSTNYLLGHAAEAANAVTECSNCHDPVAFCRSCHTDAGLGSAGRLGPGYHDAEPLWLLRHPQAARQQLETCASCHTQRDCLQCHSQLGAFQISPHGPDFDARLAYERNPVVCRACHIGDPFGGGTP